MKEIHAVILAGGRGTRLGVLTDRTPKPLIPILGEPALNRILNLLSAHHIPSATLTLGYRAEEIRAFYGEGNKSGVSLAFYKEETPLGTAGALWEIADSLTDPFLVVSGDAVTDFDLSAAIAFHEKSGAAATMMTAKSDSPLDFGLVTAGENGAVTAYIEKPSWRFVTSDRINTGIYVFSKSVLSLIPRGIPSDFSRDLFPKLIGNGLYAFPGEGYWRDIGTAERYYLCNREAAEGKIGGIKGSLPCIGEGTDIDMGAEISEKAVIGANCLIAFGSEIGAAILHNEVNIGARAKIGCAILCRGVRVGADAVIEDGCIIGENCIIAPGQKVRERTRLPAGTAPALPASPKNGTAFSETDALPLTDTGAAGTLGGTLTAAHCTAFGSALAAGAGKKEGVFFFDGTKEARLACRLVMCGAELGGMTATDGGVGFLQLARFALRPGRFDFALFANVKHGLVCLECLDENGVFLDGRTVFRSFSGGGFSFSSEKIGARFYDDFIGAYAAGLFAEAGDLPALSLTVPDSPAMRVFARVAGRLGAFVSFGTPDTIPEGAFYVFIDGDDRFEIIERRGDGWETFDRWHALAALAFDGKDGAEADVPILLPADAPRTLVRLCKKARIPVLQTEGTEYFSKASLGLRGHAWADELCLALCFLALKCREKAEEKERKVPAFATVGSEIKTEAGSAALLARIAGETGLTKGDGVFIPTGYGDVSLTAKNADTLLLLAEGEDEKEAQAALREAEKRVKEVDFQGLSLGE